MGLVARLVRILRRAFLQQLTTPSSHGGHRLLTTVAMPFLGALVGHHIHRLAADLREGSLSPRPSTTFMCSATRWSCSDLV